MIVHTSLDMLSSNLCQTKGLTQSCSDWIINIIWMCTMSLCFFCCTFWACSTEKQTRPGRGFFFRTKKPLPSRVIQPQSHLYFDPWIPCVNKWTTWSLFLPFVVLTRCVLNWFGDWSTGALYQVGKEFTSKLDLDKSMVREK